MAESTLSQVLTFFERANGPLSLNTIAHELGVSRPHLESMLLYWVRKGRLRQSLATRECGTCGIKGECPFVVSIPASYELVNPDQSNPLEISNPSSGPDCRCA